MIKRLTRTGFRKWLESLDPEESAGTPRTFGYCPIARYLWERDAPQPYVNVSEYYTQAPFVNGKTMPEWGNRFIEAVDLEFPNDVPARCCLEVLDRIEHQEVPDQVEKDLEKKL